MKAVFVDVDTQMDFLYPAGALYVPGAERLLPRIARLNRLAADRACLVLSTMDAHAEDDPEFADWPPHCIRGTFGQRKPPETLLERRVVVPSDRAEFSLEGIEQVLLEKQALDGFTNANLRPLLERLDAGRCLVYGVVTEYCVRAMALGLLRAGQRVEIVTDAVQSLKPEDARRSLEEIRAAGGGVTTSREILGEFKY